jgi:ABC-type transport system involved in cytochrome c biogenesis ATPase subunit
VADHPVIQVKNLSVRYGNIIVLQEINLSVGRGEVLALIGPNGAGKTTLIRSISGVLKPGAGQVRILDRDLASLSPKERARDLAVVPQARNLPEAFTVWQTVMMGRTPYLGWLGQPSAEDQRHVHWALERTACAALVERPMGKLSGHPSGLQVDVDIKESWTGWQTRHGRHFAQQRVDEAGANGGADILDRNAEASWDTLQVWIMADAQMGFAMQMGSRLNPRRVYSRMRTSASGE